MRYTDRRSRDWTLPLRKSVEDRQGAVILRAIRTAVVAFGIVVVSIAATASIIAIILFTLSLIHGVFSGFLALIALGWLAVIGVLVLIAFLVRSWAFGRRT